jgi:pentatricopeptide repeat protein
MREVLGVQPDVVSYTTLIQGHRDVNNLERCWEIYYDCSQKLLPGMDIDE